MKELHCLYDISRLFHQRSLGLPRLLGEIVRVIPRAWQYPEKTAVRITHGGREYRSKNYSTKSASLTETIWVKKRPCGIVEVASLLEGSGSSRSVFLDDEKKLLKAIAELLGNIVEKKLAEISLKQTTRELRAQAEELKGKNAALKELISQIELERKAVLDQVRTNIELTVSPLLSRMKDTDSPPEALWTYLEIARKNLRDVTSSLNRRVVEDRVRLSPREYEICELIRNGQSNKKIAELLGISTLTVERHRHNIRRKLHVDSAKVNLATFLHCSSTGQPDSAL
jgi:DNA-binding CsgD family transcriptional regulator